MPRTSFRFPPPAEWRLMTVASIFAATMCLIMIWLSWDKIISLGFRDPDDALRYVEVRDFLAGQSWFDVSQHRVNVPFGGPMHWSRIVDLPIAALMLLFRPLLGAGIADRLALAVVPLLLASALCFMTALAVRRLGGTMLAIIATILIGMSMPTLAQFRPMRVDHHGWQILMSAIALWAAFDPRQRRGGIIAGVAVAFWMHISSEGLPYAAMFGGVFALAFLRDQSAWPKLSAYMVSLTVGSAVLLIGTRGWPEAAKFYCDAISPVYLLPIGMVTLCLLGMRYVAGAEGWLQRAAAPAVAAIAGAAVYLSIGGQCRTGPFAALDPLVYKYWYLHVSEGRPFWEQTPLAIAVIVLPPLVGLAGMLLAIKREQRADLRFQWFQMLLLCGGAYAVSLLVMRAMSIAYVFALPGLATIILVFLPKAQALRTAPARMTATIALFAVTPLGLNAIAAIFLPGDDPVAVKLDSSGKPVAEKPCLDLDKLSGLAALPRGTIMALLDQGPPILAYTHHNVIATGHHRNNLAMRDVMQSFIGPAAQARSIMARHKVSYVAYCPANEVENYVKLGPKGFMHMLEAGAPPDWLHPIPMRPGESIKVYRVSYNAKL